MERERRPVGLAALEEILLALEAGPESGVGSSRISRLAG
jgi:hypothetical protein